MEDRVTCLDLDPRNAAGLKRRFGRVGFFAVFDGHVGQEASNYLAKSLPGRVRAAVAGLASSPIHAPCEGGVDEKAVSEALRNCFLATDADLCASMKSDAGSTCASVLVLGDLLFVANLGDSRVVLCRGGEAIGLTDDHKPTRGDETERIERNGGYVMRGRLCGVLAVSRSFGDRRYKKLEDIAEMLGESIEGHLEKVRSIAAAAAGSSVDGSGAGLTADISEVHVEPLVSPEPEVSAKALDPTDEFILVACDGLFDVMTRQESVDYVREALRVHRNDPAKAAHAVTNHAVHTKGSMDNVSVVVVQIRECMTTSYGS